MGVAPPPGSHSWQVVCDPLPLPPTRFIPCDPTPSTPHPWQVVPCDPTLLTVTSQQVTYLYSTNLPQSSMYMQRNQKLPFLREENVGGLGMRPGQEPCLALPHTCG